MNLKKKKRPSTPPLGIPKTSSRSRVSKKAIKNDLHLAYVRRHPCFICCGGTVLEKDNIHLASWTPQSDPHHCRKLLPSGLLPRHDALTIPLCRAHHKAMDGNERAYWKKIGADPRFFIRTFSKEGRQAIEQLQHE